MATSSTTPQDSLTETKSIEADSATQETPNPNSTDEAALGSSEEKQPGALTLSLNGEPKQHDATGLELYKPSELPGNRPVTVSNLKIAETYSAVGGTRPIFANEMKVAGSITASGIRPISASTLQISETYVVMGNRPVASNQIDDPATLMGYLD